MLKLVLYGGVGIALSEVVYICIRRLCKYLKKKESEDDIEEVIWTNEITNVCVNNHFNYKSGYSITPKNGKKGAVSDCKNPYCASQNVGRIIQYLDSARFSIDLAMYTFTSYEMANALKRALRRNVIVRIITDKEMGFSSGSQVISLTKLGAPVRFPISSALMHHKFCIIDGVSRVPRIMSNDKKKYDPKSVKSLLLNGSLNWTSQAFNGNWENILITSNKRIMQKFEEEFERMWIAFEKGDTDPKN